MSKLTEVLNRSTSWTTDCAIALAMGVVAGISADWLQLDAFPIAGPFLPPAIGGAAAFAVMQRQRRLVNSPAATFGAQPPRPG